jgi:hypothetical protein
MEVKNTSDSEVSEEAKFGSDKDKATAESSLGAQIRVLTSQFLHPGTWEMLNLECSDDDV